jgi:MinD-like ATPase involved in chromosome partitioning or flagellar assembly
MGLANVAVELAKRGKRVLMVDFDLEAPGLDTYPFQRSRHPKPGLVDFITEYIRTGKSPDAAEYMYQTSPLGSDEELWIMPAGKQDESYDERFRSIDWNDLYEHQDGFLLFEDLKAQWKSNLALDYVLVDSRTGHTDIGGICTRQLPDAVAIFFVPNEQNRRGLKPIVEDIRSEESGPLKKVIELLFVMANVPDLQDEEEILAEQTSRFQASLNYSELSAVIHHYNSLLMLQQELFVLRRPKSSLAREYRKLVDEIVRRNPEDRQGAILLLDDALRKFRFARSSVSQTTLETKLQLIQTHHPNASDVLRRLASLRRLQRRNDEAIVILDQIIQGGVVDSELLLTRAELLSLSGAPERAARDLSSLFLLDEANDIDLSLAIKLQLQLDPTGVAQLVGSPLIRSIDSDGLVDVARELATRLDTLPVSEQVLRGWLELHAQQTGFEAFEDVRLELVLCLIGLGKFMDAMLAIGSERPSAESADKHDSFNYAMAEWGLTGFPPADLLAQVVLLEQGQISQLTNPNYLQCLAIANWATGRKVVALECSARALDLMGSAPAITFSAWSYMTVRPRKFREDIEEMQRMFHENATLPEFIRRARSSHTS